MSSALVEAVLKYAIIGVTGFLAGWSLSNYTRVKPLQAEFNAFKAEVNAKGTEQEAKVVYVEREIERKVEVGRKEDESRIRDLEGKLRLALDGLRDHAGGRANLKDAAAAPAECRDYAADPRQLSVPSAEFLVREAARAERIVVQRDACIRQYNDARQQLDTLAEQTQR